MRKINNRGFSLVELLVIFAIMAVLVAVLTPTLLSNIEKTRLSTDKSNMDALYSAMLNAAGNPDITLSVDEEDEISYNNVTGVVSFTTTSDYWKEVKTYLADKTSIQLNSKYYKGNSNADIQFSVDDVTRAVSIFGDDDGNPATDDKKAQFELGE